VIDGQNVAVAHGKQIFSSMGISLVIDYWKKRNHPVICFLPQYYIKNRYTEKLADNLPLIKSLIDTGLVHLTPPQDLDDSYILQYAERHNAYIVSNDMFRDYIAKGEDPNRMKAWIREKCISFIFVNDEFIPNPDFKIL